MRPSGLFCLAVLLPDRIGVGLIHREEVLVAVYGQLVSLHRCAGTVMTNEVVRPTNYFRVPICVSILLCSTAEHRRNSHDLGIR